ncbi:MAG: SDR family oxidoreductase [Microcystis panniformis]
MHPTQRRRILLLGASGYVGGGLWRGLSPRHSVTGTCSSRSVAELIPIDLRDEKALAALARRDFDVVIHAAGLVDLERCEANPQLAHALNVRSVEVLIQALRGTPTRLVYLSSDNVFDGRLDGYTEEDPPAPLNVYGHSKVAAENLLRDSGHLVVRIPIVYGRSPFSDRFFERFSKEKTLAQTDIVCTPLYLPSLAPALEQLWDRAGLLHFGGSEVMTRYALMNRIRDALQLPTVIVPVCNAELPGGRLRPPRLILRSHRHSLSGPGLEEAVADLRKLASPLDH